MLRLFSRTLLVYCKYMVEHVQVFIDAINTSIKHPIDPRQPSYGQCTSRDAPLLGQVLSLISVGASLRTLYHDYLQHTRTCMERRKDPHVDSPLNHVPAPHLTIVVFQ